MVKENACEAAPSTAPISDQLPEEGSFIKSSRATYHLIRVLGQGGYGTVFEAESDNAYVQLYSIAEQSLVLICLVFTSPVLFKTVCLNNFICRQLSQRF